MSLFAPLYEADAKTQRYLKMTWRIFAALFLSLLLHSAFRLALLFEASSLCILLLAMGLFGLSLFLAGSGDALNSLREKLQNWHFLVVIGAALVSFCLGAYSLTDALSLHAILLYFPFLILLYSLLFHKSAINGTWLFFCFLLLMSVVIVLRLLSLNYYPIYQYIDEPWIYSYLINFRETGVLADPISYGRLVDIRYVFIPLAYWMELFPEPSFWAARLYQFLLFFFFTGFLSLAAYHLFGKSAAFFTFLVAFSSPVLYSSVNIRHDLSFMTFIAAGLAAYAYGLKKQDWAWHSLAGFLVGLSLFAHYHAIIIGPLLTIIFYLPALWTKEPSAIRKKDIFAFILAGLIGAAVVFFINILPNWEGASQSRSWRGTLDPLRFLILYIFYIYNAFPSIFEQIIAVIAVGIMLYQPSPKERQLLWLFFLSPLAITLVAGNGFIYYSTQIAPFFALLIGAALQKFFANFPYQSAVNGMIAASFLLLIILGSTSPFATLQTENWTQLEEPSSARWIQEHVIAGSRVIGANWYYLFLYEEYEFFSNRSWTDASPSLRLDFGNDDDAFWDRINPDVVIVSDVDILGKVQGNPIQPIPDDYFLSRDYQVFTISENSVVTDAPEEIRIYVRSENLRLNPEEE